MKPGDVYKDKYKVLQVLKSSKEVLVLLTEHIELKSNWIVKQLFGEHPSAEKEVDILKGIHHKGIPMIVDVYKESGQITMVREYVEGMTLDCWLDDKGVATEEEIVEIGIKLCEILRFLHEELEAPLIYRDLKPNNIVMNKNGDIQLIDFGIARYHSKDKDKDTQYLGTKGFAAPEQFGFSQSDERTDVFGVGATLYYLLTGEDLGKPPYRIQSINKFRKKSNKELDAILQKACVINKNHRYQHISELMEAMKKIVSQRNKLLYPLDTFKGKTLFFEGIGSGVGQTYCAVKFGAHLVAKGKKVLIIDNSTNQHLMSLEFNRESEVDIGVIRIWNMNIVSAHQVFDPIKLREGIDVNMYEYILIDGGKVNLFFSEEVSDKGKITNQIKTFKIMALSPWRVDELEETLLSLPGNDIGIILNHCAKEYFLEIKEEIGDIHLHRIPYKLFETMGEDESIGELLKEMEVMENCRPERGFFNQEKFRKKLTAIIKR